LQAVARFRDAPEPVTGPAVIVIVDNVGHAYPATRTHTRELRLSVFDPIEEIGVPEARGVCPLLVCRGAHGVSFVRCGLLDMSILSHMRGGVKRRASRACRGISVH